MFIENIVSQQSDNLEEQFVPDVNVSDDNAKNVFSVNAEEIIKPLIFDVNEVDERLIVNRILEKFLSNIQQTNLRAAAGIQDDTSITEKIIIVVVVDYVVQIAKQYGWALARYEDSFYLYTGTHWQKVDSDDLKSFLGLASVKIGVDYFAARHYKFGEDLLKQFYSAGYFSPPIVENSETKINLNNGTFIITPNGSWLKSYDKEDFMRYILPFNYDPDATCPKFDKYFDRVLPDKDKQEVVLEYLGYVFIKNSLLKLEKALILYGNGANGKSVLMDVIQQLLGTTNISNFSLQSLTDPNGYTRSLLAGKLLNWSGEISSRMNPTLFKQIVSGEPVESRMIYGKPFILRAYARLIFNTNVLPSDLENNAGFFRRFIIIEFDQTISDEEKNPMLANEIIRDELPGVFNRILCGLNRLLEQGDFSKCAAANDAVERYKRESDSVALFLEDGNYIPFKDENISLKDFYTKYKEFCKDSNYSACSNKIFSTRLGGYKYEMKRISSGRVIGVKKEQ